MRYRTAFFYEMLKSLRLLIILFILFNLWGCATAPYRRVPTQGVYHIVESGQTLYRIAKTYNVDVNIIIRANQINDPTKISVGQPLFIPGAKTTLWVEPYRPAIQEAVEKIVGPKNYDSVWRYITLHHSATLQGNAARFDRDHRNRGMGGLFYHFVIGNGTLSDDGEVEVGWRWKKQTQVNRPYDIQICLVGNFNEQQLSDAQFNALVNLINVLRKQYNIPLTNIRRHKDIKGCITECPGDFFPFDRILAQLK
ncbi:MAG: N-acetylmuramoyl-L-alanine amidase [Candidatus Ratteibacteria bacterium]|nr:N-acetylmuramoyl-L-alanine amidase [Candidatus Ratteibacteria bacterium]